MERVLQGDCLEILPNFESESIDLIYLDPPFFTNTIQKLKTRDGSKEFSYSDIWKSNEEYAEFLYKRLKELKRVLKNDGSIFVHCDKNSTHIVKTLLDDIFGLKQFQSEIIWYYKRWSNSKKGLLPSHQTIYFYSKTKDFKFKTIYNDYSETTNIDQILQKRVRDKNGKTVYAKDESENTINSESNLLKKGKKAYQNVNSLVEKLLYDIDYVPVQRNSGIDAILKITYQDSPILVRIQKENETIEDAVKSLNKAVITKASKKSFLIRTNDIKSLFEHDNENNNIEIINSTIYELNKLLEKANC